MVLSSARPDTLPVEQQLVALGDRTRLRILRALERSELTVAELCAVLQLPQSTVSRHLKVLADHAWVASRPDGTSRYYRFRRQDLAPGAAKLWGAVGAEVAAAGDGERLQAVLAERRSRARDFFASAAASWDRTRRELFGERALLGALLGLLDDDAVVGDLGCGTGTASAALAGWAGRVVAIDSSPEMLDAARERLDDAPNVELRRGELEALPVADGELDAALLLLVLHYLPSPERALAEAARALRPGGRLLLVDLLPHERTDLRDAMGHAWLGFEPAAVADLLATAGFERVRTRPLPIEPGARGPALFAATAVRGVATIHPSTSHRPTAPIAGMDSGFTPGRTR